MAWRVYVGISLCWHLGLWPFLQFQDYDPLGRGGYLQVLITHCMTPWINASIFLVGGYNPTTLAWQLETLVFRRAVLFSGHGHRIASPVDHWMGQELQVLPDHEVTKSALPARGTAWRCKRMVWVFQRPVFWCLWLQICHNLRWFCHSLILFTCPKHSKTRWWEYINDPTGCCPLRQDAFFVP